MIRSALPIMHLTEPVARRTPRKPVSVFDSAFVAVAGLVLVGGCLCLLDAANARSNGQESQTLKLMADASQWLPAMAQATGKYLLLLLASIINSGLIVLLVQSLRRMDQKISRLAPRILRNAASLSGKPENIRGKRAHLEGKRADMRREASAIRQSSPFLLSPVFR